MRAVKILTWCSSPFDVTAALVHYAQLILVPLRCMRNVSDLDVSRGLSMPSETQPSAWHAHPSIWKVILSLWGLVLACAGWAALATNSTRALYWGFALNGDVTVHWWIVSFVTLALVQGSLTLVLHCSELIANVIQDERYRRCATGKKGLRMTTNPLKSLFTGPFGLVPFVAKPALRESFASYFLLVYLNNIFNHVRPDVWTFIYLYWHVLLLHYPHTVEQIWNLSIALFIFACFFTAVAMFRPRGPQPAAYGHLQTLPNLVDEWLPVMWWGHKEDEVPYCHACMILTWLGGWWIDTHKQGPAITCCRL
ncbi:hypothetical protein M405DRAFT_896005 [Rhizopogon salebrosus TDB-379]|nr:hypothetical protein M405DRAFT_896005 [Rhizopogon salebrosus TDB-379]